MRIEGFDWDAGNLLKNETKHGLSREVVEDFFQRPIWVAPDPQHSSVEERFLAIGTLQNRKHVIVAFTWRMREEKQLVRPISARHMNKREVKRYEENLAKNKE